MRTTGYFLIVLALFACSLDALAKKIQVPKGIDIELPTGNANTSQQFGNLDYGLRIQVRSDIDEYKLINLNELPGKEAANFPIVSLAYSPTACAEQYLDDTASRLGFKVGSNINTDYILNVSIKEFSLRVRSYNIKQNEFYATGAMVIYWELLNADHEVVISSTTCTGRGISRDMSKITSPLNVSFAEALNSIDWNRIATKLRIARSAKQEKNEEVNGNGNTALEHTVIRWYIISSPQGADVSWRVVSSTPGVVNTNSNYVGTTPYETTESFDIKGLTYNNSGNVQIEVTCEKNGYLPQRKRFNLRQAIDQKEISAKFNLVKEETEPEE